MDIKESRVNGIPLLILSGRLDYLSKPEFLEVLKKLELNHWQRLLINVEQVTFMDSAGLGVLVLAYKRLEVLKREVVIVNPRGQVRILFRETNFSLFMSVVDSDIAYSAFQNIP